MGGMGLGAWAGVNPLGMYFHVGYRISIYTYIYIHNIMYIYLYVLWCFAACCASLAVLCLLRLLCFALLASLALLALLAFFGLVRLLFFTCCALPALLAGLCCAV